LLSKGIKQLNEHGPAFFQMHWLGRTRVIAGILCAVAMAVLFSVTGLSETVDDSLRVSRESIVDQPASGNIHIIEIDARSIESVNAWPWPRGIHGEIVNRLNAAGASTLAFDVDFSSPSTPSEDQKFARALAGFNGTVILPTFQQKSGSGRSDVFENLPIEPLRNHAFLASVNVYPDKDGMMRSVSYGTVTANTARPSMAAMLAGAQGNIGDSFRVNASINPASIPRHSAVDILSGNFDPAALKGKTVFIGATAVELGDRYAVPRYGMLPGVVMQALAAETLIQRSHFMAYGDWVSILIALGFILIMMNTKNLWSGIILGIGGVATLLGIPFILEQSDTGTLNIATALALLSGAFMVMIISNILGRFNFISLIDSVTGLPNERALRKAIRRKNNGHLTVMQIGNYEQIATMLDTYQHDIVLGEISRRVSMGTSADPIHYLGNGTLGWIDDSARIDMLTEMVDGLGTVFLSSVIADTQQIVIAPVFGIAPLTNDINGVEIHNAKLAATQAQRANARWMIFNTAMSDDTDFSQRILSGLDDAIADDDLYLLFQPKWSVTEARINGVEALLRWRHPLLGPLSPDRFIPVLEANGRMADLTLHIARKCGEIAQAWQRARHDVSIAINVSAPLFGSKEFATDFIALMSSLGPAAHLLTVEITESAAATNDDHIIAFLTKLRRMGLRVSIDDYGTGQSTLSYLKKFPMDEIKIDRSFVTQMLENRNDQILVRSTIEMAHELGFHVVAEGVEDAACFNQLSIFGCDSVQGWHIGRPVAIDEIEGMIAGNLADILRVA
jgi:diguanylate cyclase